MSPLTWKLLSLGGVRVQMLMAQPPSPMASPPVPLTRFILQEALSVSPVYLLSLGSSGSHTRLSVPWEQGYAVCCCTRNYKIISVRTKCACAMLKVVCPPSLSLQPREVTVLFPFYRQVDRGSKISNQIPWVSPNWGPIWNPRMPFF